jgi:hypothetical protein
MFSNLNRRLFFSIAASIGALLPFGAGAQQVDAKGVQAGIGTTVDSSVVPFVGPIIAAATTESLGYVGDLPTTQRIESHPSQTIDRTGYHPNAK